MKNNYFGKIIKDLRLEEGISQRELGNRLNVCNQTVSFWENGQREPDLDTLLKIFSSIYRLPAWQRRLSPHILNFYG